MHVRIDEIRRRLIRSVSALEQNTKGKRMQDEHPLAKGPQMAWGPPDHTRFSEPALPPPPTTLSSHIVYL